MKCNGSLELQVRLMIENVMVLTKHLMFNTKQDLLTC